MKKNTNESNLIRRSHGVRPTPSQRERLYKGEGSRRGFTIVELVVALAVIVIVSGVSIGVVSVNSKTYGETIDMIEATNIAENAVECFRFAVNNGGTDAKEIFEKQFAKSIDITFIPNEVDGVITNYPFNILPEAVDGVYTYNISDGRISVEIKANFDSKKIVITAKSGDEDLFDGPVTYTVR